MAGQHSWGPQPWGHRPGMGGTPRAGLGARLAQGVPGTVWEARTVAVCSPCVPRVLCAGCVSRPLRVPCVCPACALRVLCVCSACSSPVTVPSVHTQRVLSVHPCSPCGPGMTLACLPLCWSHTQRTLKGRFPAGTGSSSLPRAGPCGTGYQGMCTKPHTRVQGQSTGPGGVCTNTHTCTCGHGVVLYLHTCSSQCTTRVSPTGPGLSLSPSPAGHKVQPKSPLGPAWPPGPCTGGSCCGDTRACGQWKGPVLAAHRPQLRAS